MNRGAAACALLGALLPVRLGAAPLADPLLDRLVGSWTLSGTILNQPARQPVQGSWVLGHQFVLLRLHGDYQADVYVGYDAPRKHYVAHWLDTYGGSGANVVGIGTREGSDRIVFRFAYPGQPFRTTFTYDAHAEVWLLHYEFADHGTWKVFGDERLRRRAG